MQQSFGLIAGCLVASLMLLAYLHRRTGSGPKGERIALLVFGSGLLAALLAAVIFDALTMIPFYRNLEALSEASELDKLLYAFFAIGPIEELAKFAPAWGLLVLLGLDRHSPMVGPLMAGGAAMGFATAENIQSLSQQGELFWGQLITAPFVHLLFSMFWGVGFSVAIFGRRRTDDSRWVYAGLGLAALFHGLYDYILFSEWVADLMVLPLAFGLWLWLWAAIDQLRRWQPVDPEAVDVSGGFRWRERRRRLFAPPRRPPYNRGRHLR